MVQTPRTATDVVVEIGTNHPGEIAPLSKLTRPQIAICLNVQPAHIANFKDLDALIKEKVSIASGLESNGVFVLPIELKKAARKYFGGKMLTFGTDKPADVRYEIVRQKTIGLSWQNQHIELSIPGGGRHRGETMAALGAAMVAMDKPLRQLRRISSELLPGRGVIHKVNGIAVIDESYNANPGSMKATIRQFAHTDYRRKLLLLGDMRELGESTVDQHLELADDVASFDGMVCVGENMHKLADSVERPKVLGRFAEADGRLVNHCKKILKKGDALLVKGSNTIFWTKQFVPRLVESLGS